MIDELETPKHVGGDLSLNFDVLVKELHILRFLLLLNELLILSPPLENFTPSRVVFG